MKLTFWEPEQNLNPWRYFDNRMNRNYDRSNSYDWLFDSFSDSEKGVPACDIQETEGHYVVSFDMPGVNKKDIHVEVKDHTLLVSAERKQEATKKSMSERFYGCYERVFELPENVQTDNVEANYEDGVLHIALAKVEAAKPKLIKIGEGKPSIFSRLLGQEKKVEEGTEERSTKRVA